MPPAVSPPPSRSSESRPHSPKAKLPPAQSAPRKLPSHSFKEIRTVESTDGTKLYKFKSDLVGLEVLHADVEAPIVNGFFALATEAIDDYGCPHTLEHLVFLGSGQYPYKGVLDSLANRALAQGTNAWTDVDHTCYTITTAGYSGFLQLLPIYIDHILYPTLTDSGYHTEVHHINAKGEDAGVVYSEMQGRQNSCTDRMQLRLQRLMYPEECGYRSETGGLMECLRRLDVDQIREYHRSYYRPDNLCLIITGHIPHQALFSTLAAIEARIYGKGPLPAIPRPWVETSAKSVLTQTGPHSGTVCERVLFPDDDESMGEVVVAWMGPCVNNFSDLKALDLLTIYLSDSAISPMHKHLVEIENPLCTEIDFHMSEQLRVTFTCSLANVPTDRLEDVQPALMKVLKEVEKEGIDMDRMAVLLKREKLKVLEHMETNAHFQYAIAGITDFLYGAKDGSDLEKALKQMDHLDKLGKFQGEQWMDILQKYFTNASHITLLGHPSAEFAATLVEDENKRVEQQKCELGEARLKESGEILEEAKKKNDVAMPQDMIDGFPIPSVSTIPFIEVTSAFYPPNPDVDNEVQAHIDQDVVKLPFCIQYSHIKSKFTNLTLYISTPELSGHLRSYLRLFLSTLFLLPVQTADGGRLPYEAVVRGLNEDTVSYSAHLGNSNGFKEAIVIDLKCETEKFPRAVTWIRDLLWGSIFAVDRVKNAVIKELNDIPAAKRDGRSMTTATLRALQFDLARSNNAASNVLYQFNFLPKVQSQLDTDPQMVTSDLEELRRALCQPNNFRVHVSGDILALASPKSAFSLLGRGHVAGIDSPVPWARDVLNQEGLEPGRLGYIVNLPSIESSFSLHAAKGPSDFTSPDVAPLLVLNEILDTMEGIFWKLIRGAGLAYSCSLRADVEAGLVYFNIYRSPDAFKAFEQAGKVIRELADGRATFENSTIAGAKSGVIFSIVDKEDTLSRAALESFTNQTLRNVPANYNRRLLEQIQAVTLEDLRRVLKTYLCDLFDPKKSNVIVVSASGKVQDIVDGFSTLGFPLKTITLDEVLPQ